MSAFIIPSSMAIQVLLLLTHPSTRSTMLSPNLHQYQVICIFHKLLVRRSRQAVLLLMMFIAGAPYFEFVVKPAVAVLVAAEMPDKAGVFLESIAVARQGHCILAGLLTATILLVCTDQASVKEPIPRALEIVRKFLTAQEEQVAELSLSFHPAASHPLPCVSEPGADVCYGERRHSLQWAARARGLYPRRSDVP